MELAVAGQTHARTVYIPFRIQTSTHSLLDRARRLCVYARLGGRRLLTGRGFLCRNKARAPFAIMSPRRRPANTGERPPSQLCPVFPHSATATSTRRQQSTGNKGGFSCRRSAASQPHPRDNNVRFVTFARTRARELANSGDKTFSDDEGAGVPMKER